MTQVLTIGSALVDVFINSKQFSTQDTTHGKILCQSFGDKVNLDGLHVYSGGGGSNVAVGLSRAGFTTAILSETGRDGFANLVVSDLVKEGVDTSILVEEKKEQTGGSVILVGEDGQRVVMVHRGASSLLDDYDVPTYWLSQVSWVHLSSIAGRLQTLQKIFRVVEKFPEVELSWNPGKAEIELLNTGQISPKDVPCRIFFANAEEWQLLHRVQSQILACFSQVVITMGNKGGQIYLSGKPRFKFSSKEVRSIDDTGAGDAFASGFLAATLRGLPPQQAAVWGVENSASVVQHYGAKAGLLRLDALEKLEMGGVATGA